MATTSRTPNNAQNSYRITANAVTPPDERFTAMCIPGDLDDGSDSSWHVYDLQQRTSNKIGMGPLARLRALDTAYEANRVSIDCQPENQAYE